MGLEALQAGGGYELSGGRPLRFVFSTTDLDAVERQLRGMFVELSLRLDERGQLSYCLGVPDRTTRPWVIALSERDLPRLAARARSAGGCPTAIRDPSGRELDLEAFSRDLEHDWSGRTSRALAAFLGGGLDAAERILRPVVRESPRGLPLSHHLLGRCYRRRGALAEAVDCYRAAVRAACNPVSRRLIPYAAAPLSDLAVAFKLLGEPEKAADCFLHSLHLRPNHPEALLSFFSLFPEDERLVLFGAARALAVGGADDLVAQFLGNYAGFAGADVERLSVRARRLAGAVDLSRWPFRRPGLGRLDALERRLAPARTADAQVEAPAGRFKS